jgi:hypothetical protein
MSTVEAVFDEASAQRRVSSLPLSHLSIEVGHLYMEDFAAGEADLRRQLLEIAPWVRTAQELATQASRKATRISTCFLIDDYFTPFSTPAELVPMLLRAATDAGVSIDYLARESACVEADGVPLALTVIDHLVEDPPPGSDGTRPTVQASGWICNGNRSPLPIVNEAMQPAAAWVPPAENAFNRHSIFVDVELWSGRDGQREYSCPFLAAIWQLLRLGALRFQGAPAVTARPLPQPLPESWQAMPAVAQVSPQAAPFAAYRTFSVLGSRFLPVEQAVRTILSQVAVDDEVIAQTMGRAEAEGLALPVEVMGRVGYAFLPGPG